jgi:tRNA-dihydrouridine synthase B
MHGNAAHIAEGRALLRPIRLGGLTLESPVVLAPMSGVTDRPFRAMVRKFGAELVVTEMLASKAVIREQRKTLRMSEREADEGLLAVQLAGREPDIMAEAARLAADRGADIVDLNFGSEKVVGTGGRGADARRGARGQNLRGGGQRGDAAGDAQDADGWSPDWLNAPRLAKIADGGMLRSRCTAARATSFTTARPTGASGPRKAVSIPVW